MWGGGVRGEGEPGVAQMGRWAGARGPHVPVGHVRGHLGFHIGSGVVTMCRSECSARLRTGPQSVGGDASIRFPTDEIPFFSSFTPRTEPGWKGLSQAFKLSCLVTS